MCTKLKEQGIRLTLWIHPYINLDSKNAKDPRIRRLMVQTRSGEPVIANWWNGNGYVVDFTNSEATKWFHDQLNKLKELGIFSFKFDSGEVTYLTEKFHLANGKIPSDYVNKYVEMAAEFGNAIEVRVFRRTQNVPVLVRTLDRSSTWDEIGLDSILPVTFNFSIHGYHFNLPDIIGGNGYADKELFIRWMQLNQLMLSLQFSYTPWQYDKQTYDLFIELMNVRKNVIGYLIDACKNSCTTNEPVICPMWWLSESVDALSCSDQFVVNDRLIVAPVVKKGVTSRSVFLPEGTWEYALNHQKYCGPIKTVIDAPLIASVPYFKRVD
uniref:Family 31 glucosidase n=1 Tax=Ascaris suum TaxID=6253 RepID=F1L2B5_ASCSU